MTVNELKTKIIEYKKAKGVCILAHAYQSQDILEVADFVGDSFGLSVQAAKAKEKTVIMCGVRFMAETVKILSPEKKVILANKSAGCAMAEQMDKDLISQLKEMYPDYAVVAYINTTADLKTICDVCVTSSSAVKIIKNMPQDKILFIPDCNLGDWVQRQIPEKEFKLVSGGCPTHLRITERNIKNARENYPNAEILVHPECAPKIVALADFVGSTTEIMAYAKNSKNTEFVIGTENSIVEHLQFECPDKNFYGLSNDCVCHNMRITTLVDVYKALVGEGGEEIILDEDTRIRSKKCIDEMLRLGNE